MRLKGQDFAAIYAEALPTSITSLYTDNVPRKKNETITTCSKLEVLVSESKLGSGREQRKGLPAIPW
jgi:hypothetical protein